ncbi:hemerythrin domain-containing protein [Pseudoduganella sp. FT25W]|jgi:iron-sulfur cluster repair protein YtfE (RIC family)|uniref:Hemerythrin domain-containing protein n=1 Tax=Duganella alba TaxID=2666081 RepID=A0A6L5QKF3_9BURK|nr:hemerythrin domain-containing protein [Duganella alba]MRX10147.1 hemerythrin domain-containing protein [Duganella alba]MRX16665.1 hemerythrin domain-containing protein [Duganella alba]
MHKIATYLDQDHRRCDDQYSMAESDVILRNWEAASDHFGTFLSMFYRHLDKEERILFPRLDHALGNGYGPTVVMRAEHRQMRAMLLEMKIAIDRHDCEAFFGQGDMLRILMRQHSLKEEGILYPQADFVLAKQADAVVASMENIDHAEEAGAWSAA